MGNATHNAFGMRGWEGIADCAAQALQNVHNEYSAASKANGALMRATPLAVWAHRLGTDAIAACAKADAQLSHPNQACQDANAAYVMACASLIRWPGDAGAALTAAEERAAANACREVQEWLAEARDNGAMAAYNAHGASMGFVKHAFCLAFYHLRRHSGFVEGLRHTLLCGGDTDTNACIVGGVLGARYGAAGIPPELRGEVEGYSFDGSGRGHRRPQQLLGSQLAPLAERLYQEAVQDVGQQ